MTWGLKQKHLKQAHKHIRVGLYGRVLSLGLVDRRNVELIDLSIYLRGNKGYTEPITLLRESIS